MEKEAHGETRMRFRIIGTVQNVGYRNWLRDEAARRGIRGWVRNECDGSVCALFVGGEEEVASIAGLLRIGPADAEVMDATPLQLDKEDEKWADDKFVIRA